MSEFNQEFNPEDFLGQIKEQFSWKKSGEVTAAVAPKKVALKLLLSALMTAVISGIVYYMMLPAINIHSSDTYVFFAIVIGVFMASFYVLSGAMKSVKYKQYVVSKGKYPLILIGIIIIVVIIGSVVGATVFRAKSYSKLMTVKSSDFNTDFEELSFNEVPRLDASATKTLADNKLNELSQYVSQFLVSNVTYQINYKGKPIRVAPLQYGDFFKWFNNTKNGLPAYMIIDMVSQEVSVIELKDGMKYSPSELFNHKLERHLRFQFPTAILDNSTFEIDENGHPYWITASLTKKIGLFGGTDAIGAILTDAVTGESTFYKIGDVPNWVDKVYSDALIIEQYNYYGRFQKGFINSFIGQKDVRVSSEGNGYIAMNDDVWLYTGVTSVTSDASNVGFILTNQRTKETRYYEIGGSTENGAMMSAEGAVQNFGYKASFPILLNVSNEPTYYMPLKDSANIVKQYAMVNLKQRTVFGIGATPEECAKNYSASLVGNNIATEKPESSGGNKNIVLTGVIEEIRSAVKDGNTFYYFKVQGKYYSISASQSAQSVIMSVGDNVTVEYKDSAEAIISAVKIEFTK